MVKKIFGGKNMRDQRSKELAYVLINYSTNVKKGDKVSIKKEGFSLPFIIATEREIIKIGVFVDYFVTVLEVEELGSVHVKQK